MRESAVALIFVGEIPNRTFLVLRRTENPLDPWSGQISFPGGKWESEDISLLDTAIRETEEECQIFLTDRNLLLELDIAYAGLTQGKRVPVKTFVFKLSSKPNLILNPQEFQEYFWIEEADFINQDLHATTGPIPQNPKEFTQFPLYSMQQKKDIPLWGFTYEVLKNFIFSN
jgi:8-oxo-dGTP pyrophosphatase MutT (NUDIX family)